MNNIMHYKGYVGSVEFSENDGVLYGKVQGIRSLISYEGKSVQELLDQARLPEGYNAACGEREGNETADGRRDINMKKLPVETCTG